MLKYINVEITEDNDLKISLTEHGKIEIETVGNSIYDFQDLLEYNLANGEIQYIDPEDAGALTDSLLITTDWEWENDNPDKIIFHNIFWFPDYVVKSEMVELRKNGYVIFKRAEMYDE